MRRRAALWLALMLAGCGTRLPGPLEVTLPGPLPVTMTDRIGIVTGIELPADEGPGGAPQGVSAIPARPNALTVAWIGGLCDLRANVDLTRAGSPALFTVSTEREPGGCRAAGVLRRIVVVFSGIVNPDDFQVGESR